MDFEKGDILIGSVRSKEAAKHPIIYLKRSSDDRFIGVVITHKDNHPDNIPMMKEFFLETDEWGKRYQILFDQEHVSHIVKRLFIKPEKWGPYKKAGRLSEEGIRFVEDNCGVDPQWWTEYIN